MTARISPYLGFRDQARAAMEFYGDVFGAQPVFSTFEEFGMAQDPADAGKIMHSQLELPAGGGLLMASDTPVGMPVPDESSASVALFGGPQDAEALRTVSRGSPRGAPRASRWRSRRGATSSGCAPTGSAWGGWSTSRVPDRADHP
ncbi:VOC family protein [Cellulomonas xiejunii]|uniref:VOC family protein n=1 Tax=Cellulomonas xiejunii TaxID=2968083 RepID=UPI0027E194BC|nr:hypothetical protein [Cellulomonas xiejunii]